MNNLGQDFSPASIRNRWDAHHQGDVNFQTPDEPSTSIRKDPFERRLDRRLIRQMAVYSRFMVLLPELDFSKK